MRKTAAFLEEHHFQTFYGHHKVGTNTRPNLFAMMLGISPAEYQARLPPSKLLDDYAFISKDFSTGGYLTSMIEDYFPYVLFEFDGAEGFTPDNYPMDYNIDPLGRNIRHSSRFKFESACYGNRLQVEVRKIWRFEKLQSIFELFFLAFPTLSIILTCCSTKWQPSEPANSRTSSGPTFPASHTTTSMERRTLIAPF